MGRWALAALAVILAAGVAAIPAGSDSPSEQQASRGVAFVSTEAILQQTPGFQQAESTFNAEMASYQNEVQRLRTELDSALNAFQQQSLVLTPTVRQERMDELQRLQQRYDQRSSELSDLAQQRQRELLAPLEDRIQRVIDGLRAERNIGLVFDVASPANNIISADPGLDLTQVVIGRLRGAGQQ
ncbi:MAG: OmpH family outer membrane protein [Gemmatimonadales bacterium]